VERKGECRYTKENNRIVEIGTRQVVMGGERIMENALL
jgi:hypothetical protein